MTENPPPEAAAPTLKEQLHALRERPEGLRALLAEFRIAPSPERFPALAEQIAEPRRALAISLRALGEELVSVVAFVPAVRCLEEAIALYEEEEARAKGEDDVEAQIEARAGLASAALTMGAPLAELGRGEEAIDAGRRAVEAYRALAEEERARFGPELATALHNLGLDLRGVGDPRGAVAAVEEALALRRQLAAEAREREEGEAARALLLAAGGSLHNLGAMLAELAAEEPAFGEASHAALVEAVAIRRAHTARPGGHSELAMSLATLAQTEESLGRQDAAMRSFEDAIEAAWPLFEAEPRGFAHMLQMLFMDCARCLKGQPPSERLTRRIEGFNAKMQALKQGAPG